MPSQYDFKPGADLSVVASPTKFDLMQAIYGITPSDNIGGVILMSGAGGQYPDVTNNPRFSRYLWIDTQDFDPNNPSSPWTPILKVWAGSATGGTPSDSVTDWVTLGVQADAVVTKSIRNLAVTIDKMSSDSSADAGKMLVVDTSLDGGKYAIKAVSLLDYVEDGTITLGKLVQGTTSGQLIHYNGSGLEYKSIADIINSLGSAVITPTSIVAGGENTVLTTVGGTPVWTAVGSTILADNSITFPKLAKGYYDGEMLKYVLASGTWQNVRPVLDLSYYVRFNAGQPLGTNSSLRAINQIHGIPSGLPIFVRPVIRVIANMTTAAYVAGDEIELNAVSHADEQSARPFVVMVNSTNVLVAPFFTYDETDIAIPGKTLASDGSATMVTLKTAELNKLQLAVYLIATTSGVTF